MLLQVFEEQVQAQDGLLLNYYHWIPNNSKATIVISHGWSEHAGRYDEVARWFAKEGFEVHALDHRGHGKSAGQHGHVLQWTDYTRDLEQLRFNVSKKQTQEKSQYLLGHSMGGMISVLHLLEYPDAFNAAVLSGPAADISIKVPKMKTLLAKVMGSLLPGLSLKNEIDPTVVCTDKQVVEDYINDPFNHEKISARWYVEFINTIERVKLDASSITTPTAIWHGDGDELVEPWVSKNLFDSLTMKDRQYKLVEHALHEVLFEPGWQNTAKQMKSWMERF